MLVQLVMHVKTTSSKSSPVQCTLADSEITSPSNTGQLPSSCKQSRTSQGRAVMARAGQYSNMLYMAEPKSEGRWHKGNGGLPQAGQSDCTGLYLDQSLNMVSSEAEAVEVESSEGWPAGHEPQKVFPCDPTALAHPKALQPCHFAQSLCTTYHVTALLSSSQNLTHAWLLDATTHQHRRIPSHTFTHM